MDDKQNDSRERYLAGFDARASRHFAENEPHEARERKLGNGLALGASCGVAIGAGLGAAFGNLALGVSLGVALGTAIGLMLGHKKGWSITK